MQVCPTLFGLWPDDAAKLAKIAQLELAVVLMTLAYMVTDLHGHHGIWWADNIAALMALGFEDGAMSMSWTLWLRWLMLVDMVLGTFGIVTTALLS